MKTFHDITGKKRLNESIDISYLTEAEQHEANAAYERLALEVEKAGGIEFVDEGIIASILGGVTGAVVGPAIGKVIANALGVEKGILYDLFTSRLVAAALGAALGKKV